MRRLVLFVALVPLVACGSGDDDPLTGESGLTAVGPLEAEVGSVPRFEWSPVQGAALYQLAVLGPDGPIWAWEGEETSINLGGLTGDRPELMPGPVVVAGTSWSVAAIDASGSVIDLVGPVEIAPGGATKTEAATSTSTAPPTAAEIPDPCALVLQEDVDAVFGGTSPAGEAGDVTGPGNTSGGRSCTWSRGFAALHVSIFIRPGFLTPMEICDFCDAVAGLGDDAWAGETDRGSGGALLAIVVKGLGVQLSADGLGANVEQLEKLAAPVLAGLG